MIDLKKFKGAQAALDFRAPQFDKNIFKIVKTIAPNLWLFPQLKTKDFEIKNIDILIDLYKDFFDKKNRFLMAYRHYTNDDPPCLFYLYANLVPKYAKQKKIKFKKLTNAIFLYHRGIPLWMGEGVGKLIQKLGGISIRRGIHDSEGIRATRESFLNGEFPLVIAPEGGTNFLSEIVSPIESGVAQLCFWCLEDLKKNNRNEEVLLVPIGIKYLYNNDAWKNIEICLSKLEKDLEIENNNLNIDKMNQESLYKRLLRLGYNLIFKMTKFYNQFFHLKNDNDIKSPEECEKLDINQFSEVIKELLNKSLSVCENFFGIIPRGNLITRCRIIEDVALNHIYRKDIKDINKISKFDKGLADIIAFESNLKMWHLRIVEPMVEVTGNYVKEKFTIDRYSEILLNIWEVITRIKGENPNPRPVFGKRKIIINIENPINISNKYQEYLSNRKKSVENLTIEISNALQLLTEK